MEKIALHTPQHTAFINITDKLQAIVSKAGFKEGVVTVYVPHTTAAVTINENADPDVAADMQNVLEKLVPWNSLDYRHFEGNTAAHVKSTLVGNTVQVLVNNGRLQLGTWQGVYFCEFDGPRNREVWVQLTS